MEKTKHDLTGLVEEAAANMHRLMAAAPGPGTAEAQAVEAQRAASRLFEGVMATNKRFADALLDRVEPGPVVELQRRFVGEYFDALARGGALVLSAAGEAAQQSSELQTRKRDHQEGCGTVAPAERSEPGPTDRPRRPRSQAQRRQGNAVPGKTAK